MGLPGKLKYFSFLHIFLVITKEVKPTTLNSWRSGEKVKKESKSGQLGSNRKGKKSRQEKERGTREEIKEQ